ncbi:MAG: fibronectin type III domain-containing protein, partial [Bacteroidia bacterium]|nr:fibronectin type III domain-containing protein [Bacteroidia bacterium]
SGISVDFDGDDRPGPASSTNGGATSSDIGADEFDGTPAYTCSNPVAGAAVASTATGCISLSSTTLSLTGAVLDGTGNTYQWESSTNGSTFTPVAGANSATLVATSIAQTTYYRCVITCANGPISSTSVADTVAITAPVVSSTTPATRCGTGTVTLQASGSGSGFGDLKWYATASGGTAIGTGSSFTTPSISSTTNYYVSAVAAGSSTFSAGKAAREPSSTATNLTTYGQLFTITEQITLNSVKVESTTGTAITVTLLNSAGTTQLQTTGSQTVPTSAISTINLGWVIPAGTYRLAVTGMTGSFYRDNSNVTYPMAIGSIGSITGFFSSLTGSNTTSASYYFLYDWSVSVGCESARTMVTATVTAPPALTTNVASATICEGSSSSSPITISSNVADYDSYAWTPSSSVSGNSSIGFTFNPTSTTNYTLSANNTTSGCSNTASVTINVNPRPTLVSTTPSNPGVCSGVVQSLTVSGGTIGGQGTIGSATTLSTATTQPTAFCNRWSQYWMQMVYTAAELQAAGLTAGTINSVAFNITTLGDASNVTNMRVALGTTSSSTLIAWQTTGLTQVYGPSTYNHAIGWNTITFTTPFVWDGVSNILLDVRHDGVDMTNNAQTYYTATSGTTVLTATTSTTSSTSDLASTNPTPSTSVNRLNTRFDISSPVSYVWSPSTDLYTDALASTAYTNTNASTLYVKPTSSRTYTITATNPSTGCFRTGDVNVTMLTAPSAPSAPTLVSATSGSLDISWTAVSNATDYRLDVATDASFTSFVSGYNDKTVSGTTETVGGLSVGTTYYVRLRASNSCGASSNSTTLTTITLSSAPVLANASAVSTTGMTINWNASTGAASYKLDLATDNAFTSFVSGYQDLTVSGTSQAVTGLTAATRYYYRVRAVNASGTSGNSLTGDTITLSGTVGLSLTAFFEGLYLGSSTMTAAPYNSDNLLPDTIADTITVVLHDDITFDSLYAWRGPISTSGLALANFPGAVNGNDFYIAIRHRNSIETWSAAPVTFGSSASYNFSTASTQAYGDNMANGGSGVYLIFTGDINQDGSVDFLDYPDLDVDALNGELGYLVTDLNGDSSVDFLDYPSIDLNALNGVIMMRP